MDLDKLDELDREEALKSAASLFNENEAEIESIAASKPKKRRNKTKKNQKNQRNQKNQKKSMRK